MNSTEIKIERIGIPWQKRVADLCTAARGPLALALVWLGVARGKDGIQIAFILLLIAATLDTMDGYFARVSACQHQTWVGAHDLAFDLGFSVAMLLYLSLAGYLSPFLAAGYVGIWLLIFNSQEALSSTLAVLSQAPIYAGIVLAAISDHTNVILWIVIWVGVMLFFAGKRFFHVRLPEFLGDLSKRFLNGKRGSTRDHHKGREVKE